MAKKTPCQGENKKPAGPLIRNQPVSACLIVVRNGECHAEEGAPEKENARVKPDILRNAAERGSGERGDESLGFPAVPLFGPGAHRAAQPYENAEEKAAEQKSADYAGREEHF